MSEAQREVEIMREMKGEVIMHCNCPEGFIRQPDSTTIRTGLGVHDCAYIMRRNTLIPAAVDYADSKGFAPKEKKEWNQAYQNKMNELAKSIGF